jgi:acetyl-CoA C-acetyltransferase
MANSPEDRDGPKVVPTPVHSMAGAPMLSQPVILSAVRTPIGSFQGCLEEITATELGSMVVGEAVRRAAISPEAVDEIFMGNVFSAGLGQAPARQAAICAGLPASAGATAVNKVCGSSLKAVIMAAQSICCGDANVAIAGGMENMSRVPYLVESARRGYRLGHAQLVDSMIKDGLWDVYNNWHMGNAGELCARRFGLTRQEVDDFAMESYARARRAIAEGAFTSELMPVPSKRLQKPAVAVVEDEEPNRIDLGKLRSLRSAFESEGVLTAGNSSKCNDGAAALVMASSGEAARRGLIPLARILGYAEAGIAPEYFPLAPIEAIHKVLKLTGLSLDQLDLFEINEAFSSVSLGINRALGLDRSRVNVHGGAVALGHPIGATGARILTTLVHALKRRGGHLGLASLCIGGGEAIAVVVESLEQLRSE